MNANLNNANANNSNSLLKIEGFVSAASEWAVNAGGEGASLLAIAVGWIVGVAQVLVRQGMAKKKTFIWKKVPNVLSGRAALMADFVQEVWDITQRALPSSETIHGGGKYVILYRGFDGALEDAISGEGRVVESWTTSFSMASWFARRCSGSGYVLIARIPVENIIAHYNVDYGNGVGSPVLVNHRENEILVANPQMCYFDDCYGHSENITIIGWKRVEREDVGCEPICSTCEEKLSQCKCDEPGDIIEGKPEEVDWSDLNEPQPEGDFGWEPQPDDDWKPEKEEPKFILTQEEEIKAKFGWDPITKWFYETKGMKAYEEWKQKVKKEEVQPEDFGWTKELGWEGNMEGYHNYLDKLIDNT